ncbi:MAG TPA: ubiquinol-cytochrome c reductase iron-sulfur subunit [Cyclobacteriaceae bacterium]|nr:ubiquinol-cytochrome c reductase iron-sulfur subunit [Cyclobacteriaceae bacterium]
MNNIKRLLGLVAVVPLADACSSSEVNPKPTANFTIDITNPAYSSLLVVGGVVNVQGIFIVRESQSTYVGLSHVCTHAGCTVNFSSSSKQFVCPCHGGVYDIYGRVVSGPPPSPLAQYQVSLTGNMLTVTG